MGCFLLLIKQGLGSRFRVSGTEFRVGAGVAQVFFSVVGLGKWGWVRLLEISRGW